MGTNGKTAVLDREQLRNVTLDDADLMREILAALVDDTSRQMQLLKSAIHEEDPLKCMRLAHYSKGACANLGANTAAALLIKIERQAAAGDFGECSRSLAALAGEVEALRTEALAF